MRFPARFSTIYKIQYRHDKTLFSELFVDEFSMITTNPLIPARFSTIYKIQYQHDKTLFSELFVDEFAMITKIH